MYFFLHTSAYILGLLFPVGERGVGCRDCWWKISHKSLYLLHHEEQNSESFEISLHKLLINYKGTDSSLTVENPHGHITSVVALPKQETGSTQTDSIILQYKQPMLCHGQ